jgi:hypothetical protein
MKPYLHPCGGAVAAIKGPPGLFGYSRSPKGSRYSIKRDPLGREGL